jgi:tripartite-type tricarboxylate transporter receptor subunit TctC
MTYLTVSKLKRTVNERSILTVRKPKKTGWKQMASSRRTILSVLAGVLVIAAAAPVVAQAQDYPTRGIKIVVPFPPGGNPDLAARLVAHQMSIDFGQTVVIENKPGANGGIGASTVAKAPPDGYTLLVANLGILGLNPVIRTRLLYDPLKDFVPVSRIIISPLLLIADPALKVGSIQEFIALAKKEPGKLSYSSAGVGSAAHMSAALFEQMTGTKMLHVPYRGASEAAPAVAGGNVSITFGGQGASWSLVAGGNVKALGLTGTKRSSEHPEVPTIAESGVPGYEIADWAGMLAPAGTPQPIIDKLNASVQKALNDPDTRRKFELQGLEPAGSSGKEFMAFIQAEQKKWADVAKKADIHIQE